MKKPTEGSNAAETEAAKKPSVPEPAPVAEDNDKDGEDATAGGASNLNKEKKQKATEIDKELAAWKKDGRTFRARAFRTMLEQVTKLEEGTWQRKGEEPKRSEEEE